MNICCVSDLHGHLIDIPDCELLLIAGDILPLSIQRDMKASESWINTNFRKWIDKIKDRNIEILSIWGNHDFIGETIDDNNYTHDFFLHDSAVERNGLKIYGTPYQSYFGGWAFNLHDDELRKKYDLISTDTDILLVHNPPYGILDVVESVYGGVEKVEHCGSKVLLDRLYQLKNPKLICFGHIHEAYGVYLHKFIKKPLHEAYYVNASICDAQYKPTNQPILVDF